MIRQRRATRERGTYSASSGPPGREEVYKVSSRLLTLPKFFSGARGEKRTGGQCARRYCRTVSSARRPYVCVRTCNTAEQTRERSLWGRRRTCGSHDRSRRARTRNSSSSKVGGGIYRSQSAAHRQERRFYPHFYRHIRAEGHIPGVSEERCVWSDSAPPDVTGTSVVMRSSPLRRHARPGAHLSPRAEVRLLR